MPLIDCDVHPAYPSAGALRPFLSARWQEFLDTSRFLASPAAANAYPPGAPTSFLAGTAGGSMEDQIARTTAAVLDQPGALFGVLNLYYGIDVLRHPDWAQALTMAVNDWLVESWLSRDRRWRGSLQVQARYPVMAAEEIDRLGSHPGFVQVLLPVRSEVPYGNRSYDPLYEAAVRHDLAIGIHFGGMSGNAPTSVGWPTYYFEEYVGMPTAFQSQVTSLIVEGVFDRFPQLKVVLLEGGWAWLPTLMWRLDKEWRGLRRETPWLKQLPSAYIREHIRASLQPIDGPPDIGGLLAAIERIESDDTLMFSTGYPHNHGSSADELMEALAPEVREKILATTALEVYSFSKARAGEGTSVSR
jgi:uncharacterized protein